jgi:hypothetical protein
VNEGVRARLRAGGAERLADLLLDDLLARPIAELVDARWLAERVAEAARAAVADPTTIRAVRERAARARVPSGAIPVPEEVRSALEAVLRRPYVPDRALVRAVLSHDTARRLGEGLVRDLLVSFAQRLKPPIPTPPLRGGLPNLGRLSRIGEGLIGGLGHELEAQLEQRARDFATAGMTRLLEQLADHLSDPAHAAEYARWRVDALRKLLTTDARTLAAEAGKLDDDGMTEDLLALARAVVGRGAFVGEVEAVLRAAQDESAGRTLREALAELGEGSASSLEALRELLRARVRATVETDAFAAWWDAMSGEAP